MNFVAGSNVTIDYIAAGTGSGQSGSADYFNIKISATNTTYSVVTNNTNGLAPMTGSAAAGTISSQDGE